MGNQKKLLPSPLNEGELWRVIYSVSPRTPEGGQAGKGDKPPLLTCSALADFLQRGNVETEKRRKDEGRMMRGIWGCGTRRSITLAKCRTKKIHKPILIGYKIGLLWCSNCSTRSVRNWTLASKSAIFWYSGIGSRNSKERCILHSHTSLISSALTVICG